MLRNLKIFLFVVLIIVLGSHWKDGYKKMNANGIRVSFLSYVKYDTVIMYHEAKKFFQELPYLIDDTIQSDDKIRRGSLNKLADGLEIYKAENEFYPDKIEMLLGTYITPNNKLIYEDGFSYAISEDKQHFELSIKLKSGENYTIER